jgi:hypothetical protein
MEPGKTELLDLMILRRKAKWRITALGWAGETKLKNTGGIYGRFI